MKVDWKQVSKSSGYRSLKKAYIDRLNKNSGFVYFHYEKEELYKDFQWVIGRANHYAHIQNLSLETVLDSWEAKRNYCWRNYYQDCNFPKLK